ncbi:MAG: adenylate cyclase [Melioribacteraceae bacterium]|nr:MAG: adenylate cyclase [Melioribacteraceae bacterium]
MAKNLEIKVKVESLNQIENILLSNKLRQIEILEQKDIYYKTTTGRLKLRIENGDERLIYYNRSEQKGEERFSDYELLEISSANGESFFSKLYDILVVVEKRRVLYIRENTRIHLDLVKNLGEFVELETIVTVDEGSALKEFEFVVQMLGLKQYEEYRGSYSDLMLAGL